MSRDDTERGHFSPRVSSRLPDIVNVLHTSSDSSTAGENQDSEEEEDDDSSISPSSSPHQSALLAHSRNPRFPLSPVQEDRVVKSHSHQGMRYGCGFKVTKVTIYKEAANDFCSLGQSANRWTWETRYIQSTTLTVAESNCTAYFCMDFPEKLRKRIAKTIHSLEALAKSPLFMDTLIIDELINFYRDAIKVHRSQMLAMVRGLYFFILLLRIPTHFVMHGTAAS